MPNMNAPNKISTDRSCQQRNSITIEHHYQVIIFNNVIDFEIIDFHQIQWSCFILAHRWILLMSLDHLKFMVNVILQKTSIMKTSLILKYML